MPGYRPPQRQIDAWILAGSRWLRGTFHVPRLHSFDDHLQKPRPFLLLTEVSLGGDVVRVLPEVTFAGPGGDVELLGLYFTDPDGLAMQIQDVKYCGGGGLLGELCPPLPA